MKLNLQKKSIKKLSQEPAPLANKLTPQVAGGYLGTYMECFSQFGVYCPTMPKECNR
ncbi:hypothetical protein ACSLBF_14050 [Pseudoalteromonas sp. T1lg65]|uniref:hypothetical protein n=1 Tax=Pseudoalteromonas sp. T1lg65 TaxID=2077101 RepID=UPI003F79A5C4